MEFFSKLFSRKPDPREELRPLWQSVVAIARQPHWYAEGGVEDSVTGRFDMVTMAISVVLDRMTHSPELDARTALLTELFVEDMDSQLREFGVNDVVVGKRMGRLMSTLGGRLGAVRDAVPQGNDAMSLVVSRNVTLLDNGKPELIAQRLLDLANQLDQIDDASLLAGEFGGGIAGD